MSSSMVFVDLPTFSHLCCITLTLQEEGEELRSQQMKTCRELVLLYSDVLASPALESFTEITVVMALKFFQMGLIQMFGSRRRLMLAPPQHVLPGVLQACLSFSVVTRLSPHWNKVGVFLASGKDFVSNRGKMDAVRVEWSFSEGQLCLKVEANTIRIPPPTLEELHLPPLVLRKFWTDPESVLEPSPAGRVWCQVLPSMKKGQIITISRKLPQDGPFRTYGALQNHWKSLYGYSLPDLPEAEQVYCSVYFRQVGERLFTYPLSCIRLQQVQCCPPPDQQGVLGSFLADISTRLQSVCGFHTRLIGKGGYRSGAPNTTVQGWSGDITLAAPSTSSLPPQVPPDPRHLPTMPHSGSQRSALPSQQDRALSRGAGSSTLSALVPTSSSVLPPPPPTEQPPPPKLVPIWKNKSSSRQVSIALLRLRNQTELLAGAGLEMQGRGLPACRNQTPPTARNQTPPTGMVRPHLSRLWVPPAPKVRGRAQPRTVPKQQPERGVKKQPGGNQTSQVSLGQVSQTRGTSVTEKEETLMKVMKRLK